MVAEVTELTPADYAAEYLARGWAPVPIAWREKGPRGDEWQIVAEARGVPAEAFTGNVGVLLGTPSGGLVDVDLDCPEALELAPYFLPPTLTFGRESARFSHWLYQSLGCRSIKFKCASGRREDVDIRADKAAGEGSVGQTVFPGSTHKETGEAIEFEDGPGEPTQIEPGELHWAAQRLAMAAAILKRYREGDRHHLSLGYSGWLLNEGWTADEVRELMAAVRAAAGDTPDEEADFGHDVESTIKAMALGKPIAGASELRAVGADLEWAGKLTLTPEKRLQQAQLAGHPSRIGQSMRARLLAEARSVDGTAADLVAALAAPDPHETEPSVTDRESPWATLPLCSWTDANEAMADIPWVCRGMGLGPGKVSGIVGYANSGKTPFALLFAACVARGLPFLGHETRQGKVAYICFEGVRLARKRLKRICAGLGFDLAEILGSSLLFLECPAGMLDPNFASVFSEGAEALGVIAVVLDTYNAGLVHGVDHNSPAFAEVLQSLGSHSDASGITYIALLQEKKGEGDGLQKIAGTYAMAAALQASITLSRPEGGDRSTIEVTCSREVEEAFETFRIAWKGDGEAPLTCGIAGAEEAKAAEHKIDIRGKSMITRVCDALAAHPQGLNKTKLRDLLTGDTGVRGRAIDAAFDLNAIHLRDTRPGKPGGLLYFAGPDPTKLKRSAEAQAVALVQKRHTGLDEDGGA